MRCPNCRSIIAEDVAVCPACEAVIDSSLLDPTPVEGSRAPERSTSRTASRPSAIGGSGKRRPPRPAGNARSKKQGGARMPEAPPASVPSATAGRNWREEISQEDWNAMPQGPRAEFVPDRAMDPDDFVHSARAFLAGLSTADKLAFFGSATTFLACFFPWKETVADGEVLGLLSLGVVVFLLAVASMVAIAVRVRSPSENSGLLRLGQLAAVVFSELWSIGYAAASVDATSTQSPVGNFEMWVSKPSFGLVLAFLAGLVAVAGTVMGVKEAR